MSLVRASRHATARGASLRSSYAEISRFFRPQHHGIAIGRATGCSTDAVRSFTGAVRKHDGIHPDGKLRNTLDEFKASSMSGPPYHTFLALMSL